MIALQSKVRSRIAMGAAVISGITVIYIPGVIWFILPALFIKRRVIIRALKIQPMWFKISTGLLSLAMLVPLILMLVKPLPGSTSMSNLSRLFGLPSVGLPTLTQMGASIKDVLGDIFVYSTAGPLYTAGHLPWFDVCTTVLTLIGITQFIIHRRLDRSKLIGIAGALCLLLISLSGLVSSIILLPFLFLFVIEGLKWLLDRWMLIFPRNPFARSFAIAVVTILVGAIAFYQTNKYFYAWSHAPETREVFNKQP
jgi:hypothetical protein